MYFLPSSAFVKKNGLVIAEPTKFLSQLDDELRNHCVKVVGATLKLFPDVTYVLVNDEIGFYIVKPSMFILGSEYEILPRLTKRFKDRGKGSAIPGWASVPSLTLFKRFIDSLDILTSEKLKGETIEIVLPEEGPISEMIQIVKNSDQPIKIHEEV